MRFAGVIAVLLLLFNLGKWSKPNENQTRSWVILNDVSASMSQPTAEGTSRADIAKSMIHQATNQAKSTELPLLVYPFSSKLETVEGSAKPIGTSTNILPAITQLLQDASAAGDNLAGVIVLSDGRQTLNSPQTDLDALALRARSRNVAVNTVVIGAYSAPPDLALIQPRASLTAFSGQPIRIAFALQSSGIEAVRPIVSLRDSTGKEITKLTLDLAPNKNLTAEFDVPAPSASTQWSIETPVIDGEVRSSNNKSVLNIRIIESKTRVFLVEGAPYWDSKFLAQLLRQQPHMDVRSIHRLSNQRYFRIDSGETKNQETDHPIFPDTLDELAHYDLIVFGKNIDAFLTPERTEFLRSYVRDRGGAVLFSRGKPTTAAMPSLEPLEPVVWAATSAAAFRFSPTRDGEAAGLFGQALPAPDASLWAALPTLKDGRQISLVKPFTRILAEGIPDVGGGSGKFPALLVRRYGQGVTGLVNGDGLWKWDFFPEARELGNCYEDFWNQLIQWMASYSEFLPGQDFSLRLPTTRGEAGKTLTATISYRGNDIAPQPTIQIVDPIGTANKISPAAIPDPSGRPLWRASFTPDQPGLWKLKLIDPRPNASATPEVLFTVPPPTQESDDLSPDPDFLNSLAKATGGRALQPTEFPEFLNQQLVKSTPTTRESGAVWKSSWDSAALALTIAVFFAIEWFIRRRNGLS